LTKEEVARSVEHEERRHQHDAVYIHYFTSHALHDV
jgi:hypothetical protein